MFTAKVDFDYNVNVDLGSYEYIDRVFITLLINLKSDLVQDPSDHPLFQLSFDYPPNKHYPPEDGWVQMKQAILKKEDYTLLVYNYDGTIALQADTKGLSFRGITNYRDKRDVAEHDGCHFFLPLDDDLRQELALHCDEINAACAKVDRG